MESHIVQTMGRYYLRGCLGTVAAREPNPSLVRSLPQRICGERDEIVRRVLMVEPLACHCRGESCHGTRGSADLFRRTVAQKAGAPSDDITSWFTNRCLDQNTVNSLSAAGIPRNILQYHVIYAFRPTRIWTRVHQLREYHQGVSCLATAGQSPLPPRSAPPAKEAS